MNDQLEVDVATAAQLAAQFEATGQKGAAANVWKELCRAFPYDRAAREKLADLIFDLRQSEHPQGTLDRSRFLSNATSKGFPTKKLRDAYFENLEQLLKSRTKRSRPGAVVLGLGTGRCGSTSLTAAFAGVDGACSTHENHPIIYWEPQEEQVRFHFDRMRLLADYHSVVFDAAHWWLNVLGRFFAEFPEGKVVGLARDTETCVQSFLRIQVRGPGAFNHWAPPDSDIWRTHEWDPSYPSYPVPLDLLPNVAAAKVAMIERYVNEYNQTLRSLAQAFPDRVLLIRTEDLNDPDTMTRISALVGLPLSMPAAALNAGTIHDGDGEQYKI